MEVLYERAEFEIIKTTGENYIIYNVQTKEELHNGFQSFEDAYDALIKHIKA